jgi:hypothetical protein
MCQAHAEAHTTAVTRRQKNADLENILYGSGEQINPIRYETGSGPAESVSSESRTTTILL